MTYIQDSRLNQMTPIYLLHLAVELPHARIPLLPLLVEALQQFGPLATPPLLAVLQLPAEVQRGAVALRQQAPVLLALLIQNPLGVPGRSAFVTLCFAPHCVLGLQLQLARGVRQDLQ